jgi:hypothetical protein
MPIKFLIQRIYDEVHIALWALAAAGTLYFLLFLVPRLPEINAQMERARIAEIAAENKLYCERWGMPAGTRRHIQCTLDLDELRAGIERRFAENLAPF